MSKKFFLHSDIVALQRRISQLEAENSALQEENDIIKTNGAFKEQNLISSLQEENASLSRTIVESNRQQEVMDNQITSLKQQNDTLDGQKSDLEEQLFAALQHRHQFASTVSAPVFPLSHNTRKSDIQSIDGLPFTPVQAEIAMELFYEFSGDGLMSKDAFSRALLFAFACCFVSTDLRTDSDVTAEIRNGVVGSAGALLRGINLGSTVFTQTFEFFDINQDGKLDLQEFCCGLAKMSAGSMQDWAEYAFFITDQSGSGTLTVYEVRALLREFMAIFTHLQSNVVAILRPFLVRAGVPPESLEAHLSTLEANKAQAESVVQSSLDNIFSALDGSNNGTIGFEEWVEGRAKFPKIFSKLRFLCVGVITRNRPSFFEIAEYMPESLDLSPSKSPTSECALPHHHMAALAASPSSRGPAYELEMFERERRAGFRK